MEFQKFAKGNLVAVRFAEEIFRSLDKEGTVDGLPFMPEMWDCCGRTFRVERRVEKTCVSVEKDVFPMRRFAANDVVVLEGLRCSGRDHDGCDRQCKFFWKEDWLRPAEGDAQARPRSQAGIDALRARLKTKAHDGRYFCQSTQMRQATEAFPGRKKPWMARVLIREIRNGDVGLQEATKLLFLWGDQKIRRLIAGRNYTVGPNDRTPSKSLGLKPGDRVRIKSRSDIKQTLDRKARNRGMVFCNEMFKLCGATAEVRGRVNRIIDGPEGEMIPLEDSVTLRNIRAKGLQRNEECLCYERLGDCPRRELMYWREIWLERDETGESIAS